MSVSGEEALEFLLDFYKFSETLLLVFQTDSVGHFTPQLSACVRNLIEDEDFLSFLVPTSCYPGSQQVQLEGADVAASGDKLKALLAAVIDALNPHVIAGFCGFIHNIYVAFPECVSPYLHHCSLVVHLTRYVIKINSRKQITDFTNWPLMKCKLNKWKTTHKKVEIF